VTIAAPTRARRSSVVTRAARATARNDDRRSRLGKVCSVALLFGAGLHLNLGIAHAGSNFGTLSLLAAAAQASLAVLMYLRRSEIDATLVVLLELVLLQLYLLNVTIGLPPAIAHVHDGGEHVVWGYTFALPGVLDLEGACAVASEAIGATLAGVLLRGARLPEPI
jgi:hypothetical protein